MTADRARGIIASTTALAMKKEMPIPACFPGLGDADSWRSSRFEPSASDIDSPAAQIYVEKSSLVVDFSYLRFSLNDKDEPTCWDVLIVVD
jgi:hypothetical protein